MIPVEEVVIFKKTGEPAFDSARRSRTALLLRRLLETEPEIIDLARLGIPAATERQLREFIIRPQGLLLVSGPTGSGKSTTLYSMLREVDRKQRNVVAIEDPIEYHLDYVTQIAV